jgi:predicted amidohydrolase YtcJ
MNTQQKADLILYNGKISTLDANYPEASNLAIGQGRILAVDDAEGYSSLTRESTKRINLNGRRLIPGLNDSHLHVIRGGLFYNLELRWDGVPSISQALEQLKEQADRTPPPQWVRVIGGWNEFQFKEGRMPTLDEINRAAPDTPVFLLHLYDSAMLNRAAIRALGMTDKTPNPPGGLIARDASGQPTGLLIAEPNALILYSTIAKAPKLDFEDQLNSTRHYMRELNRFGLTSMSDAGGGGQNYPEDYAVIQKLAEEDHLTARIAYSLFAQKPGTEKSDYERWIGMTHPGDGNARLKVNGAGENLVWSAADFENFLQPRPDLKPVLESELESVVQLLAEAKWPWRIHATYDETISRFLDIFEKVHQETPIDQLRWFIDHAETIGERNLERVAALGGGLAIQHRMAFQGEYFIRRYGKEGAKRRPPIRQMMRMGLPVGAGTDGTRVASYHPWTCLWWLVTSKTVGGTVLHEEQDRLSREEALRLYTQGSAWFSSDEKNKGTLKEGALADLAVLSSDYFGVEEDEIRGIESVLTMVDGQIVYASEEFASHCPDMPPASPNWAPSAHFGGYNNSEPTPPMHQHTPVMSADGRVWETGCGCGV